MKIPFGIILGPILKSNFSNTRLFCQHSALSISVPYTFVYSTLGVCINAHHLKKHLGEIPLLTDLTEECSNDNRNAMLNHDLKIIAMSMGLLQYSCLLAGCFTENPSLFLPYLAGQLIIVCLKIVNASISLIHIDTKAFNKFHHKLTTIALIMFNWLQGFCVFRKHLCICDL